MKFLIALFVVVALQASVQARPEPGIAEFFASLFGQGNTNDAVAAVITPENVQAVATPENIETAVTVAKENPGLVAQIIEILRNFMPFLSGRASDNPFANILTLFVDNLKSSEVLKQSPAVTSFLDIVDAVVKDTTFTNDPIQSLAMQTTKMGNDLMQAAFQSIPSLIDAVTKTIFNVQSRSLDSVLGDLNNMAAQLAKPFGEMIGLAQSDIDNTISQIMNIRSDKQGFTMVTDLVSQALHVLINFVGTAETRVTTVADDTITTVTSGFQNALEVSTGVIMAGLTNTLNDVAGGAMEKCVEPIGNSILALGTQINVGVSGCINDEVHNIMALLSMTTNALTKTDEVIVNVGQCVESVMNWNAFDCIGRIMPITLGGIEMAGLYAAIPGYASATFPTIQSRATVCLAKATSVAILDGASAAMPLATCVF